MRKVAWYGPGPHCPQVLLLNRLYLPAAASTGSVASSLPAPWRAGATPADRRPQTSATGRIPGRVTHPLPPPGLGQGRSGRARLNGFGGGAEAARIPFGCPRLA